MKQNEKEVGGFLGAISGREVGFDTVLFHAAERGLVTTTSMQSLSA